MTDREIAEAIVINTKNEGMMAFPEIEAYFEDFDFNYEGTKNVGFSEHCIVWAGWNYDAVNIINMAIAMGLSLRPCSPLVYWYHGYAVNAPLAQKPFEYKETHWLPCVLVPNDAT